MKCRKCGEPLSQQHAVHEKWRLWRRGLTRKQTLGMGTLCHDCTNQWLSRHYKNFMGVSWRDYKMPEKFLSEVNKF